MQAKFLADLWRTVCKRLPGADDRRPEEDDLHSVDWNAEELAILRTHIGKPCYFEGNREIQPYRMKSSLLHFSASSGLLLFDACWPNRTANTALLKRPLAVSLLQGTLKLDLKIECLNLVELHDGPALQARVLNKHLGAAQAPGLAFVEQSAPSASLLIPCEGLWHGSLSHMTTESLSLRCLPTTSFPRPGKQAECRLHLADQLEMALSVRIGAVRFERQPHRHRLVKLIPTDSNEEAKQRFEAWVGSLAACSMPTTPGYNAGFSVMPRNAFR